jgi:hypothetical protein
MAPRSHTKKSECEVSLHTRAAVLLAAIRGEREDIGVGAVRVERAAGPRGQAATGSLATGRPELGSHEIQFEFGSSWVHAVPAPMLLVNVGGLLVGVEFAGLAL